MEIILPKFGLFFWTVAIFLTVFFLLSKFAWKPILAALKARDAEIESKLNAAREAEARMAQLTSENEKLLQQARLERDAILKEANAMKDKIISEAQTKANAIQERMLAEANQQIEMAKNAALKEIYNLSAALALNVAEKVIRKELSNKTEHENYVRTMIEDIKLN